MEMSIRKRLMALDYGERRIGVALTDDEQIIAFPYKTIDTKKTPDVIRELTSIILTQNVVRIIIGNPQNVAGEDSLKSKLIKEFAHTLQNNISIPIEFWNESNTTKEAVKVLVQSNRKLKKNRNKVDQIAASLILKDYLEHHS